MNVFTFQLACLETAPRRKRAIIGPDTELDIAIATYKNTG